MADDVSSLAVTITRLGRWLHRHDVAGLTPAQLSTLAAVDHAPQRLGDLAILEGVSPSTMTRLVAILEGRDYVERCPTPGDRRSAIIQIAPAGRLALYQVRQAEHELLAARLRMLTDAEVSVLAAALPVLERLAGGSGR